MVIWNKIHKIFLYSIAWIYHFYLFMYSSVDRLACLSCSVVSNSMTPLIVAHQAPLSVEFPRQEYWSGLPFPSPEDLPNPGIEPMSPMSLALQVDSLPTEPSGKPTVNNASVNIYDQLCVNILPLLLDMYSGVKLLVVC